MKTRNSIQNFILKKAEHRGVSCQRWEYTTGVKNGDEWMRITSHSYREQKENTQKKTRSTRKNPHCTVCPSLLESYRFGMEEGTYVLWRPEIKGVLSLVSLLWIQLNNDLLLLLSLPLRLSLLWVIIFSKQLSSPKQLSITISFTGSWQPGNGYAPEDLNIPWIWCPVSAYSGSHDILGNLTSAF